MAIAPLTPPLPIRATADTTSTRHCSTYCHPHRPKLTLQPNPSAETKLVRVVGVQKKEQRYSLATGPSDADFVKDKIETSPIRRVSHPSKAKFGLPSRPVSYAVRL